MQEERGQKESVCSFPGSPDPSGLGGQGSSGSQSGVTHPLPPTTFCTVGLGWVVGGDEEELSRQEEVRLELRSMAYDGIARGWDGGGWGAVSVGADSMDREERWWREWRGGVPMWTDGGV